MVANVTRDRVLRALDRGPLYIGVLPIIVDATPSKVLAEVRHLARKGKVTYNSAGTVTRV